MQRLVYLATILFLFVEIAFQAAINSPIPAKIEKIEKKFPYKQKYLQVYKNVMVPEMIFFLLKNENNDKAVRESKLYVTIDGGENIEENNFFPAETNSYVTTVIPTGQNMLLIYHEKLCGILTDKTLKQLATFSFLQTNTDFEPHPKYYHLIAQLIKAEYTLHDEVLIISLKYPDLSKKMPGVKSIKWFEEEPMLVVYTLDDMVHVLSFETGIVRTIIEISNVIEYSIVKDKLLLNEKENDRQVVLVWNSTLGLRRGVFPKYVVTFDILKLDFASEYVYVAIQNSTLGRHLYVASIKDLHFNLRLSDLSALSRHASEYFTFHPSLDEVIFANIEETHGYENFYPTVISSNNGFDWAKLISHPLDNCKDLECEIKLHLPKRWEDATNRRGANKVFSCDGMFSKSRKFENFHLYTIDSGLTWVGKFKPSTAFHTLNYESILVAIEKDNLELSYSTDYGEYWSQLKLDESESSAESIEEIYSIEENISPASESIFIIARLRDEDTWKFINIKFSKYLGSLCTQEDYEGWSFPGLHSDCHQGRKINYFLKKYEFVCRVAQEIVESTTEVVCTCSSCDYGCEYGYIKLEGICEQDFDFGHFHSYQVCQAGTIIHKKSELVKLETNVCVPSTSADLPPSESQTSEICELTVNDHFMFLLSKEYLYYLPLSKTKQLIELTSTFHKLALPQELLQSNPVSFDFITESIYFAKDNIIYKIPVIFTDHNMKPEVVYTLEDNLLVIEFDYFSSSLYALTAKYVLLSFNVHKKLKRTLHQGVRTFKLQTSKGIAFYISTENKLCMIYLLTLEHICTNSCDKPSNIVEDSATNLIYITCHDYKVLVYEFSSNKEFKEISVISNIDPEYLHAIDDGNVYILNRESIYYGLASDMKNLQLVFSLPGAYSINIHTDLKEKGRQTCHALNCDYICIPLADGHGSCVCPENMSLVGKHKCVTGQDKAESLRKYCDGVWCADSSCFHGVKSCSDASLTINCGQEMCLAGSFCCGNGKCAIDIDSCKLSLTQVTNSVESTHFSGISSNKQKDSSTSDNKYQRLTIAFYVVISILSAAILASITVILYRNRKSVCNMKPVAALRTILTRNYKTYDDEL